ncbi:putative indole-3-pyruvate monooxygenase YUCCA7 [Fusarium oxysporum f. sp. albedinis]|nr:putative indole-3-pyruvate monooxygenase YUCCA7 [Fusarium oxysporum f. sp. albedinis]
MLQLIFRSCFLSYIIISIACDIYPKGPEKHSDRRRDLVILDHHDDDDPIEAAYIYTNRRFDVSGIIGLYASYMAQNSKDTEGKNFMERQIVISASVVSGIEVKATKPAATVTSGAITTTAAASATETAGNSAGKMTGSIMAVTWVNLTLLLVL